MFGVIEMTQCRISRDFIIFTTKTNKRMILFEYGFVYFSSVCVSIFLFMRKKHIIVVAAYISIFERTISN